MDFFLINPQKSVPHGQFQLFFFLKWHLGSEDQKLAKDKWCNQKEEETGMLR